MNTPERDRPSKKTAAEVDTQAANKNEEARDGREQLWQVGNLTVQGAANNAGFVQPQGSASIAENRSRKINHPKSLGLGNLAVQRLCNQCEHVIEEQEINTVQAKLEISAPGDSCEREADAVADKVVKFSSGAFGRLSVGAMPVGVMSIGFNSPELIKPVDTPLVHRKCSECETEPAAVQAKGETSHRPSSHLHEAIGGSASGVPLSDDLRTRIEPVLGADLSQVRIHSDTRAQRAAAEIHAKAFTVKNNIYLGAQQRADDLSLMAHEATHTVQQSAHVKPQRIFRSPLDPANPRAWSFLEPRHRHQGWARDTYLETLGAATEASMNLEGDMRTTGAPETDEQKRAFAARSEQLVRLNALGLMASHRATIAAREQEILRSFSSNTAPRNQFEQEVDDRPTLLARIRATATKVHQLQNLKEELEGYRRDLAVVHARSLISMSTQGNINDMYNTIADSASTHSSPTIRNYLRSSARNIFGQPRSGDSLRLFAWGMSGYLERWRKGQINGIDLSLGRLYETFPFFSELDAEDFSEGDYTDDDVLEQAVRDAYQEILNDIDAAIINIGSGDTHPFNLPEAVNYTKNNLPAELHRHFDEAIADHRMEEFWWNLGLTFAQIALIFVPVVGPALAAGLGALDLAMQAEEIIDQMTLSDAATNPEGELLGVGGPGTLDWTLLAVTAILTAADLGMVAREFRAARGAMALESLRLGEGQLDNLTALIDDLALDPVDVGRLGTINDETLGMFQRNPELLGTLSDNPLAARLLKHCASPCWPENLQPWVVEYLDDLMNDLGAKGLSLEDIGISRDSLRARLAAVESDDGYTRIFNELENGLDRAEHLADETRRGAALYDELGTAMDDGAHQVLDPHMVNVEGAHDVGVSAGRDHAHNVLGLQEANWVNPFEFRRSRFGQGFDDVLQDSAGNLWIVEYKGGAADLSRGQMSAGWVRSRIARYRREGGELGRLWADRIEAALNSGRLRGVALSTPIDGRTAGQTVELGRWVY